MKCPRDGVGQLASGPRIYACNPWARKSNTRLQAGLWRRSSCITSQVSRYREKVGRQHSLQGIMPSARGAWQMPIPLRRGSDSTGRGRYRSASRTPRAENGGKPAAPGAREGWRYQNQLARGWPDRRGSRAGPGASGRRRWHVTQARSCRDGGR